MELGRARDDREALVVAHDRERIAADLHDHVIQSLVAVGMGLERITRRIDDAQVRPRLSSYVEVLHDTILRVRATIAYEPGNHVDLRELGVRVASVCREEGEALGFGPELTLHGEPKRVVPAAVGDDVVAVVREGLSNVARHAEAMRASVVLALDGDVLVLEVQDDGRGLGTSARSSGLEHMRRRARAHGGGVEFLVSPGGGTTVRWWVPLSA
jgi:signal transduction histidine kinase